MCPVCGKSFARKYTRDRHLQNIHDVRLPVAIHRVNRAPGTPIPQGDDVVDFEPFTPLRNRAATSAPLDDEAGGFAEVPTHRPRFEDLPVRKRIKKRIVPAKFKRVIAKIRRRRKKRGGTPIPQGDDAVDFEPVTTLRNTATTPAPKPAKRGPSQTHKCHLKRHVELLEYLRNGKKKVVHAIINEAEGDIINILCECAHNTLLGNVPMSKAQFCRLKRFKKHLRTLARKKVPLAKKKKILQTGGFLPALLGAALPIITNLVGGLFR